MMCVACSSNVSTLIRGIVVGSTQVCISVLIHWLFFVVDVLVSVDGVAYVTCSDFAKLPYPLARWVSNTKLKLIYKRSQLSSVLFYISFLLDPFPTCDPSSFFYWVVIRCIIIINCLSHI